jgi:hypothetical protein
VREPVYTIVVAFEGSPVASCFGLRGLLATVPRLEPGVYQILEGLHDAGAAARHPSGRWTVDMHDGVKAGPGFVIV